MFVFPADAMDWASKEIEAPYHLFNHNSELLSQIIPRMQQKHQDELKLFMSYVKSSFDTGLQEARQLFSQGLVSYETVPYLFNPGMCVVSEYANRMICYQSVSWLKKNPEEAKQMQPHLEWILETWNWNFDGSLYEVPGVFIFGWQVSRQEIISIKSLTVYPLMYAKDGLEQELLTRGRMFWTCKQRRYVSYIEKTPIGSSVQVSDRIFPHIRLAPSFTDSHNSL